MRPAFANILALEDWTGGLISGPQREKGATTRAGIVVPDYYMHTV